MATTYEIISYNSNPITYLPILLIILYAVEHKGDAIVVIQVCVNIIVNIAFLYNI